MKVYEYIRGKHERIIKLFGKIFMRKTFLSYTPDGMTTRGYQSLLGGLITTTVVIDQMTNCSKKDLQILGNSVLKRIEQNNYRTYYLFGKEINKVSLLKEFKKQYLNHFDKDHDDIYILQAPSGEIYLILTYVIDALIKKNGSKKPLLVATLPYHVDIIRVLCPDIPYVYIERPSIKIAGSSFRIDSFRIFILLDLPYFKWVNDDIRNNSLGDHQGEHHYFKSILNKLEIKESELQYRKIVIPAEDESRMLNKIAKTGLNINQFVFIAPEAMSCKLYDEDFWCELINSFQDKGYDVFVSLVRDDVRLNGAKDYKTCGLSFAEAFALAKRAQRIVALRSGFTEFLLQTGVPIDALYTRFRHRGCMGDMDIHHVIAGCGMTQIPFVDTSKIREFNTFEMSPRACLEKIRSI